MRTSDLYRMFAGYNRWANGRLYDAAAQLSPEEFQADRGVFFRSAMGTLNHLLAADRIWLQRLIGTGDAPNRLDAVLFPEFEPLRAAREAEDQRLIDYVDRLDDAALAESFTYRTITSPRDVTQPVGTTLAHLFNHQTHHRGQAHAILTGFGRDAPSLDLIYFQRETGVGL